MKLFTKATYMKPKDPIDLERITPELLGELSYTPLKGTLSQGFDGLGPAGDLVIKASPGVLLVCYRISVPDVSNRKAFTAFTDELKRLGDDAPGEDTQEYDDLRRKVTERLMVAAAPKNTEVMMLVTKDLVVAGSITPKEIGYCIMALNKIKISVSEYSNRDYSTDLLNAIIYDQKLPFSVCDRVYLQSTVRRHAANKVRFDGDQAVPQAQRKAIEGDYRLTEFGLYHGSLTGNVELDTGGHFRMKTLCYYFGEDDLPQAEAGERPDIYGMIQASAILWADAFCNLFKDLQKNIYDLNDAELAESV